MATLDPATLARLLEKAKALKSKVTSEVIHSLGKHGEAITYNAEQAEFVAAVLSGKSVVLIGAAGTGKTTCLMGAITAAIQSGRIPVIADNLAHKYLVTGTPGIIATSFTRRAVANDMKAMPQGMKANCITMHKTLEYAPVYYEIEDPITREPKKTMRFEPTRNHFSPLPSTLKTIIIDESSMVSVELYKELVNALPHQVQWIFLGDINQLPPIFGSAILGFKLLELPTIELTQVYRQALESPIIEYATKIRLGETFSCEPKITKETSKGKVTFHPWKKKLSGEVACLTFCKFINSAYDSGGYSPESDIILVPFNKAFGTIEINKHVATHLAKAQNKEVWEIIAGFNKLYFSVGDKVLYDKEDATITKIVRNGLFVGKNPQKESVTLNYWGHDTTVKQEESHTEQEVDFMLSQMASLSSKDDERVRAASHLVTVQLDDSEQEIEISTASDLNNLLLSYALTVHKSQGSEWNKVFLVLHQSHSTMIQRELLYTAVTRAAKELYCICEPDTFVKGVLSQKIKGTTLAEKAEYFKGVLSARGGTL